MNFFDKNTTMYTSVIEVLSGIKRETTHFKNIRLELDENKITPNHPANARSAWKKHEVMLSVSSRFSQRQRTVYR